MRETDILKRCDKTLKAIENAPALSCVEYYFIPWLKNFYPVETLYADTIVSFRYAEKLLKKNSYEAIGLPRLQDIAEKHGIVAHEKKIYHGESPKDNELLLLRVNQNFFTGKQYAWREDHYVQLVTQTEMDFYVINEYPAEVRKIPRGNANWLQGECLSYQFLRCEDIERAMPTIKTTDDELEGVYTMEQLRDVLMVYRVSLKRLCAFLPHDEGVKALTRCSEMYFYRSAIAARKNPNDSVLVSLWRDEILKTEQDYLMWRSNHE